MTKTEHIKSEVKLFGNVQFIYELILAKMELESFGIEYSMKENLRTFDITKLPNQDKFIDKTAYFESLNDTSSLYKKIVSRNITRSINQYLTHWFYPYKGKFHPQMIRALFNYLQIQSGDTILDPFIGSGTTALEAQLLGVNCVGIDVSEVCYLISKAKTDSIYSYTEIKDTFYLLEEQIEVKSIGEKEQLQFASEFVETIENENCKNFFRVAELITHSDTARRRKKGPLQLFYNNSRKMLRSVSDYVEMVEQLNLNLGKTNFHIQDARKLKLQTNSIDGIITSPPYSIALDYVENDKHSFSVLGKKIDEIRGDFIGVRGKGKSKIELYNSDMIKAYEEMDRVLKPDKKCAIIIGNATLNKQEIKTVEMTIEIFKKMGYSLEKNIDKIIFGLYNVMQKENILIFAK
ncbi:MAG: TRM11 family SAM-dependent methyltransferase [Candidatus Heimdallarchaeaceae archaeon]